MKPARIAKTEGNVRPVRLRAAKTLTVARATKATSRPIAHPGAKLMD